GRRRERAPGSVTDNGSVRSGRAGEASVVAGVAAFLLSFAIASSGAAIVAAPPKLSWQPCADPAQKGFQCATPTVPRNYRHRHGAKIHLAVIRHRATDPAHRIGTLFFNPGGPGA